jgi:AhpD family alkylhydroperoxidase
MTRISTVPGTGTTGAAGFAGMYMQRPELWQAFRFGYGALWEYSTLDATTKEMMRLRSAFLNGCKLCQVSRGVAAKDEGLTEDTIAKIQTFRESDIPVPQKLALEFAERWILDRAYSIDDELIDEMKQHYTEPQIVEIAIAMGNFEAFHKFNNAFDLDSPIELFETGRVTVPPEMRVHLEGLGLQPAGVH